MEITAVQARGLTAQGILVANSMRQEVIDDIIKSIQSAAKDGKFFTKYYKHIKDRQFVTTWFQQRGFDVHFQSCQHDGDTMTFSWAASTNTQPINDRT